jgi:hypothetical protein
VKKSSAWSSGTEAMVGRTLSLSPPSFAKRNRAWSDLEDGAGSEEADEIEEERETRDESEIIDSGEDAAETEFASDERRVT